MRPICTKHQLSGQKHSEQRSKGWSYDHSVKLFKVMECSLTITHSVLKYLKVNESGMQRHDPPDYWANGKNKVFLQTSVTVSHQCVFSVIPGGSSRQCRCGVGAAPVSSCPAGFCGSDRWRRWIIHRCGGSKCAQLDKQCIYYNLRTKNLKLLLSSSTVWFNLFIYCTLNNRSIETHVCCTVFPRLRTFLKP